MLSSAVSCLKAVEPQMQSSDASTTRSEAPRRKREISAAEREERDARRAAKADEERAVQAQHDEVRKSKVEQAEARFVPFDDLLY